MAAEFREPEFWNDWGGREVDYNYKYRMAEESPYLCLLYHAMSWYTVHETRCM